MLSSNLINMSNKLLAREGTSDEGTWHDVFDEDKAYHRPPRGLHAEVIFDLGAYVGYTTWDFLNLYPNAEVYCIEPDPDNFELMFYNLYYITRAYATQGAISDYDGVGSLYGEHYNAKKIYSYPGDIDVWTLDKFIGSIEKVDYIKFDIEGAERYVFEAGGDWPKKTKCLTVELHDGYTKGEAAEDLYNLGFPYIREHKRHPDALVAHK